MQYRGYSDIKLTSPMTMGCGQWKDVYEVVSYIYNEYCRATNRKLFVMGFSLGGNWVALALAKKSEEMKKMVTACVCLQPPHWVREAYHNLQRVWHGAINAGLGHKFK